MKEVYAIVVEQETVVCVMDSIEKAREVLDKIKPEYQPVYKTFNVSYVLTQSEYNLVEALGADLSVFSAGAFGDGALGDGGGDGAFGDGGGDGGGDGALGDGGDGDVVCLPIFPVLETHLPVLGLQIFPSGHLLSSVHFDIY